MKKIVKWLLSYVLTEYQKYIFWYYYDKYFHRKKFWYRWVIKGKENKDKRFILFVSFTYNHGICAVARDMTGNIKWAEDNGYIPVIMHIPQYDFWNLNWVNGDIWSKYFDQDYSIRDIISSKHVLVDIQYYNVKPYQLIEEKYEKYIERGLKYYIQSQTIRTDVRRRWDEEINKMFEGKNRILGVSLREGFNLAVKWGNQGANTHPSSININEMVRLTQKYLEAYSCDYVFVATTYVETINAFKEHFDNKVIYINRDRIMYDESRRLSDMINKYGFDLSYETAKMQYDFKNKYPQYASDENETIIEGYLKETYALSQCALLLADVSSSIRVTQIWNNGNFEKIILPYIDKRGKYY